MRSEDQFCEIISNLDRWFRRCLKMFLICSSAGPSVQHIKILVEGIRRNNSMKLF